MLQQCVDCEFEGPAVPSFYMVSPEECRALCLEDVSCVGVNIENRNKCEIFTSVSSMRRERGRQAWRKSTNCEGSNTKFSLKRPSRFSAHMYMLSNSEFEGSIRLALIILDKQLPKLFSHFK